MLLIYFVVFISILSLNIVPLLMPPTWIVLSFLYIHYHLDFIPTILVGASAATLGRVILALIAKKYFRRFFSKKTLENYKTLGKFIHKNKRLTIPAVITYAFFPIPSNQFFIMTGLTGYNLKLIAGSFLIGRLISYTFWVKIAYHLQNQLQEVFVKHLTSTNTLITEVLGFGLIILIGQINWKKLLRI